MSNYVVSDTNLTAVANAIRSKTGGSSSLEFPDDFISEIGNIVPGGFDTLAELEANTLTSWANSTAATVSAYLFYNKTALTSVSYSSATAIGDYSFSGCTNLSTISFPKVKTTSSDSFSNCLALTTVSLPEATSIAARSFSGCSNVTSVSLPKVTSFGNYAFLNCTSLTTFDINTDYTGSGKTAVFQGCSSLQLLDLEQGSSIGTNMFNGCTNLTTVVLRTTGSVCSLGNINAFTGTPFASNGSGGTLYVPEDLIATYQSASNWSTILGYQNNQIKAIEGSIYDES